MDEWKTGRWLGREITLHASSIENFCPPKIFDLCVMINVIEHCWDLEVIFSKILEMTGPGSTFIFADKIYHAKEETRLANYMFDAGHPLKADYSFIREFLATHFDPTWDAEITETVHSQQYKILYFMGTRRTNV